MVSPLGNNKYEVIGHYMMQNQAYLSMSYQKMGFRSQVSGQIKINLEDFIDRKYLRFMGDGASYNYLAMLGSN